MQLNKRQFEVLEKFVDGEWRHLTGISCNRHTLMSLLTRRLIERRGPPFEVHITDAGRVAYLDNRATGGTA